MVPGGWDRPLRTPTGRLAEVGAVTEGTVAYRRLVG